MRVLLIGFLLTLPGYVTAQNISNHQPTIDEILAVQAKAQQEKHPTIVKETDTLSSQERNSLMNRLSTNFKARRGNIAPSRVTTTPSKRPSTNHLLRNAAREQLQQRKSRLTGR